MSYLVLELTICSSTSTVAAEMELRSVEDLDGGRSGTVRDPAAGAELGPLAQSPDPQLRRLIAAHGVEEGALAYLEAIRWPRGLECPRCSSPRVGTLAERRKHFCRDCGYQFRVGSGTVLQGSHLALSKWLLAVHLMLESENGCPASRIQALLGTSYHSSWFVAHRIRAAMSQPAVESTEPAAQPDRPEANRASREPPSPDPVAGDVPGAEGVLARQRIVGAYRRPSARHMAAYRAESRWRSAQRTNQNAFGETVRALLETAPLTYRGLTGQTDAAAAG
jgi:transposase-like protein